VGAHCSTLTYFTAHIPRIPHPQLLLHPNPLRYKWYHNWVQPLFNNFGSPAAHFGQNPQAVLELRYEKYKTQKNKWF